MSRESHVPTRRLIRIVPLVVVLGFAASCADDATGPDDPPPPGGALLVQRDVEALIAGGLAGWWRASHGPRPGAALSVAADAHTSSWRNWGMLDAGAEPRQPLTTDPDSPFQFFVEPWLELYRTLAAARDGLVAISQGTRIGQDGADTERVVAFGKFLQGIALGQLAVLFDRAFVLDENTDPGTVQLSSYPEVLEAALAKLDEAIERAEREDFTIPADWVAFKEPLEEEDLARLARSYRARFRAGVARSPAQRAGADWQAVLADAEDGIVRDWSGFHDGDWETNWAWAMDKLFAGVHPVWARLDYRTIGPADASGAWEEWINQEPFERRPFVIDTDDSRITDGSPTSDGSYVRYDEDIWFQPQRGLDHFSLYTDRRWAHLVDAQGVGDYPDFPVKELDFLRAEALFRLGQPPAAMEIVNHWRANGQLPPFVDANGVAPGGARCVPQMPDGSCGDLWEAFKYEKRIELFHYGSFIEFLDDRGWGDLVAGTFVELQAPQQSFEALLEALFGDAAGSVSASFADFSPEAIHRKRLAYEAYDRNRNLNPGDVGTG